MNLQEIFTAWKTAFNPNEAEKQLASLRMNICNSCEHKKTLVFDSCGLCGCPLAGKTYSQEQNACPAGKWSEIDKHYFENRHKHRVQQSKK